MRPEAQPNLRNLFLLSLAAAACGGFWGWELLRPAAINLYDRVDNYWGLALFPYLLVLVMGLVFQIRIVRIVIRTGIRPFFSRPFLATLLFVLNAISVFSLVATTVCYPLLWLFAATIIPIGAVAVAVATCSIGTDVQREAPASSGGERESKPPSRFGPWWAEFRHAGTQRIQGPTGKRPIARKLLTWLGFMVLVPSEPYAVPFSKHTPDGLALVFTASTPPEADWVGQLLQSADIDVVWVPPVTTGAFGTAGA